jgi:hypothetical protein
MTTNAGASDMAREAVGFGAMTRARARTRRRSSGCSRRNSATASMRSSPFGYLPPEVVPGGGQVRPAARGCSWPTATSTSSSRRGARLAGRARLRRALWRAPDGPPDPGEDQEAARRGAAVRQAGGSRTTLRCSRSLPRLPRPARARRRAVRVWKKTSSPKRRRHSPRRDLTPSAEARRGLIERPVRQRWNGFHCSPPAFFMRSIRPTSALEEAGNHQDLRPRPSACEQSRVSGNGRWLGEAMPPR